MNKLVPYFWEAIKRERIHARVVLDMGDYVTAPIYEDVIDASEWDATADLVSFSVKDNVWANIPGEKSLPREYLTNGVL